MRKHRGGGGGGGGGMNLFEFIFDPKNILPESSHKPQSTYQKSLITDQTYLDMWPDYT